ncbi:YbaK/EbsC family protein [Streptomyces gobiensis]|uniref:YbaK/EbsC family protein n=1 Tax=Streptomyces gobiensis TaxID=2875706 RepID=UPI001E2B35AB|nr:YbaK/EbsC family protein [Streptomyces gobiensis]UGY91886.1 YbaK/EbsC family protein [Streptomyces gobiensis]
MDSPLSTPFGSFEGAWPAVRRPELVARPVADALEKWAAAAPVESVLVVDTDPDKADTAAFCEAYDVAADVSANCVVVAAKRGQQTTLAACVVLATTQLDVNRTVRKHLGARKASFAAMDMAVAETGMEYGGITPIGLPGDWPLLVDEAVTATPHVLIGSGLRRGKLIVPGSALGELPGAETIAGLGK